MTDRSAPIGGGARWPAGTARLVLGRCGSTNAEALARAATEPGPVWVMSHEQTAGRGRRGRDWAMPPGNFAASLALRPSGSPGQAALLSFVAALALDDALRAACGPQARLALKWPNDVLLNGGKVAGILLESAGRAGGVDALAVGIGVNLAATPDAAALEPGAWAPVSVLGETGLIVAPEDFLDLLAPAFDHWHRQLRDYGFAPIRTAWLARAAKLGETITARTGRETISGRFDGIDDDGALMLTLPGGATRVIAAADVHFEGA